MVIKVLFRYYFCRPKRFKKFFFLPCSGVFLICLMLSYNYCFLICIIFFHVVTSEMIGFAVFSPWLCYIHLIKTCSHFEQVDVSHDNVAFITLV
jgi:hypothetical protein